MDLFNKLIANLSKEESRFFKLYLLRTNAQENRKDILLFDAIKKTTEKNDELKIFTDLYADKNKNAYYRLKNRLSLDIYKSLFLQHCEQEPFPFLHFMLGLSSMFIERKQFDIAKYILEKTEAKATSHQSFEILDLIYTQFINISIIIGDNNIALYLKKRKLNREKLNKQIFENDFLAFLGFKFKDALHFSPEKNPLSNFLTATMEEYSSDSIKFKNPIFRYKIFCQVFQKLIHRKEYKTLEIFLLTNFLQFNDEGFFQGDNEMLKQNFLKPLISALIINKKFERALNYWQKLYDFYNKDIKLIANDEKYFLINTWFYIQIFTSSESLTSMYFPIAKVISTEDDKLIKWFNELYYCSSKILCNNNAIELAIPAYYPEMGISDDLEKNLIVQLKVGAFINSFVLNNKKQTKELFTDLLNKTNESQKPLENNFILLLKKIIKIKKDEISIIKTKNSQKIIKKFIESYTLSFDISIFDELILYWLNKYYIDKVN